MVPTTYRPTHNRTLPPPDQGETKNRAFLKNLACFFG